MKVETFNFTGYQDCPLPGIIWLPDEQPVMILQICHGMSEHMGRYEALAMELTAHGIAVAGYDLRGHGENPSPTDCANLGENGWQTSIEDVRCFSRMLRQHFPGIPLFLLGFSIGSFLVQQMLARYPKDSPSGVILLGTGHEPRFILSFVMFVIKLCMPFQKKDGTPMFIQLMSFGVYNMHFKEYRTKVDWFCSDRRELEAYLSDPLCRKDISLSLIWNLLNSMKICSRRQFYETWNSSLPVLLLSGSQDAVSKFGKGQQLIQQSMNRCGMEQVTLKTISQARHDIFHEYSSGASDEATACLIRWMKHQIA